MIPAAIEDALRHTLGSTPQTFQPLAGGDTASAWRVGLADGTAVFVKTHPRGEALFEAEADGLCWLDEADALRIPQVLARGTEGFMAMEFIAPGPPARDYDERLGRGLAGLHRAGAPGHGHTRDNFIATLAQDNTAETKWARFYGERRLLPMAIVGHDRGRLPLPTLRRLETLVTRLDQRCGPPEPPARLHGDLWSGNVLCSAEGGPVLIDPAVYGGHREMDLAMMRLFGGFSTRCFAAYDESFALMPGHEERVELCQLYPLLVHVALFGGSYTAQAQRIIDRYL